MRFLEYVSSVTSVTAILTFATVSAVGIPPPPLFDKEELPGLGKVGGTSFDDTQPYDDTDLGLDEDHHTADESLPRHVGETQVETPPRGSDFPPSVPLFGVDCFTCSSRLECILGGSPQFCNGGIACYTSYVSPHRQIIERQGCTFDNDKFTEKCGSDDPTSAASTYSCYCKGAATNPAKQNSNYTGGTPNCNRRAVKYVHGGFAIKKNCADRIDLADGECKIEENTDNFRCYCKGGFCNQFNAVSDSSSYLLFTNSLLLFVVLTLAFVE
ncbi:unnamed protein product [Notodromas monacha]|uniref:Uncharacterized protein n=1 Tax=Notodromas monacha TaxID=399045 RepID=A0A7R9BDC2_9CRUS|nr:unnamed protein product [Notodromas monacha]CAG0913280.1 unnamed protein product [Notodromas monacha]